MLKMCARLLRSIIHTATRTAFARRPDRGPASDWLPPVIGPEDWRFVIMCDRSAGWYFDRR